MKFMINKPQIGDKRQKSGFLIFPKKIDNQLRWLEFAKWEEIYSSYVENGVTGPGISQKWEYLAWKN